MLNTDVILLLLGFALIYYSLDNYNRKSLSPTSSRVVGARSLFTILLVYLLYTMYKKKESFLFEVSDSPLVNCCSHGFNGRQLQFHYQGDNSRFNNCPDFQQNQIFPQKTASYELLGETYVDSKEGYCGCEGYCNCNSEDKQDLGQTYNGQNLFNPVKTRAAIPTDMWDIGPNVKESFCGSCSG